MGELSFFEVALMVFRVFGVFFVLFCRIFRLGLLGLAVCVIVMAILRVVWGFCEHHGAEIVCGTGFFSSCCLGGSFLLRNEVYCCIQNVYIGGFALKRS